MAYRVTIVLMALLLGAPAYASDAKDQEIKRLKTEVTHLRAAIDASHRQLARATEALQKLQAELTAAQAGSAQKYEARITQLEDELTGARTAAEEATVALERANRRGGQRERALRALLERCKPFIQLAITRGEKDERYEAVQLAIAAGFKDLLPEKALPKPDLAAADARVEKALTRTLRISLDDVALKHAVAYLRAVLGIDVVTLPGLAQSSKTVTLMLERATAVKITDLLTRAVGGRAEIRWGALVLGTPADLEALGPREVEAGYLDDDPGSRKVADALMGRTLTVNLEGSTLTEVRGFLAAYLGVKVELGIGKAAADGTDVTIDLTDARADNALHLMLRPHGLTHRIRKGVVRIVRR